MNLLNTTFITITVPTKEYIKQKHEEYIEQKQKEREEFEKQKQKEILEMVKKLTEYLEDYLAKDDFQDTMLHIDCPMKIFHSNYFKEAAEIVVKAYNEIPYIECYYHDYCWGTVNQGYINMEFII